MRFLTNEETVGSHMAFVYNSGGLGLILREHKGPERKMQLHLFF